MMVFYPFPFFLLMYLMSFVVVMGVNDWVLMWLGLEMNMISFLAMMYDRQSVLSIEVCMSYYFMQGVASALFVVVTYSFVRHFEFMCYLVMMVKVGGGPFYYWLVSVFLGLSWFSGWVLVVMQKVLPFWVSSNFLGEYVYLFALVSLLVGAGGLINQSVMSSLMIYSSVHHLGWMMVSMMVSWELWVLYIILYGVIVSFVFFFLSSWDTSMENSWLGLASSWGFVVSIFNMGGIPPMLGFFLKMYVLFSVWGMDSIVFMVLVGVSVLVLYIYLRLLFDMLVGAIADLGFLVKLGFGRSESVVLFSLLGGVVGAGLMWGV